MLTIDANVFVSARNRSEPQQAGSDRSRGPQWLRALVSRNLRSSC